MDKWEETKEFLKKSHSRHVNRDDQILKLLVDDPVEVVFLGEPFVQMVHDVGGRRVKYKRNNGNSKPFPVVSINVFLCESGEVKVFEMSESTFAGLCKVRKQYPIDKFSFEVVKTACFSDLSSKSSVSFFMATQIFPEEIDKAELIDLEKFYEEKEDEF